MASIKWG